MFFVKSQTKTKLSLLWAAKVAKLPAVKLYLIHLIVKSNNALDDASSFSHEYPKGIYKTGPRALIVFLTNICFR
jgi:hypothetical protein